MKGNLTQNSFKLATSYSIFRVRIISLFTVTVNLNIFKLLNSIGQKIIFKTLFFFVFISTSVLAQELNFEYFTPDEGLSQSSVNCILQDKEGFMWFGTMNGLNKFDGYKFVKYYHNPEDSTTVAGDQIDCLFEDSDGDLWVGSNDGLSRYNRDLDAFENYIHIESDPTSLSGLSVSSICEDSKGQIWVATLGAGLNLFNKKEKKFIHFLHNDGDSNSIATNNINDIVEDGNGRMWIATEGEGLDLLNPGAQIFIHHKHKVNDPTSLSHNNVYVIIKDKNGTIWAGTVGGGLCRINKSSKGNCTFENFRPNTADLSRTRILTLLASKNNGIWIGTENGGLDYFDCNRKTFTNYRVNENTSNALNNNSIHAIYEDKTGNLWVGTYTGGVNVVKKNSKKIHTYRKIPGNPNSLSYNAASCFFEEDNGDLWVGTDGGGLNIFDRKTGQVKQFNMQNSTLKSDAILAICEDNDGDIWVGGWECGLNLYDRKSSSFTTYSYGKDGIPNDNIFDILLDRKGRLWMAFGGIGFAQYHKTSKTFVVYTTANSELPSQWVLNLTEDFDGNIIMGHSSGFSIFNPETETFKNYSRINESDNTLSNNQINTILTSRDSTLLIGTVNGLTIFDQKKNKFFNYYEQNGLPNNNITGLVEDDFGFIWMSTSNGISKFDPESGFCKNYSLADGLQGKSYIRNSCFKTSKGEIIFGGTNGFNVFYPDSLFDNPDLPLIVLTDFSIFNKSVKVGQKGSPLSKHISQSDQIVLSYKQSVISFEFAALDYTAPEQNQYAYKLEGFEKEWNYVGTKRNATYTNLDPGEYVFRVKGSNNDGKWNENGLMLNITVTPPFWETWWFKIIAFLFIVGSLIGFYFYRINTLRKQKINLEKLVDKRTHEIKEKNKTLYKQTKDLNNSKLLLEERQQQIEEQADRLVLSNEQLILLNATKDRFFSIIAHDLRNPFNNILGFTEILNDNNTKIDDEEIRAIIKQLYISASSTYELLENLLEWSRTQSDKISFEPQPVDVVSVCKEVINTFISNPKKITINCLPTAQITITADVNMFKTVLRNLISNAIKFTNINGAINVDAHTTDYEVTFTVSDNGIGIEKENLPKLFDFTQKFSLKGTAQEKGTGLGLLLCKEFVEKHGGKIWVESELGKGSDFKFTIPFTT